MSKRFILIILSASVLTSCGSGADAEQLVDGILDNEHRIFITSSTYNGNFGSITQANSNCSNLAKAAGLERSYRAILSIENSNVKDRLLLDGPIYIFDSNNDKVEVTSSVSRFWGTDTYSFAEQIQIDESNNLITGAHVWTGTQSNGIHTTNVSNDCNSWTSSSTSNQGDYGINDYSDNRWIEFTSDNCDELKHLYCISK